jgi:hypothetical protein
MRALTRLVLLALLALGLAWGVLLALALLRSTGLGIYYTSLFSVFPLGIAYFVLLLALWGVAHITRNLPARKVLLGILGAVFLLLPIAEELFIAWRFTQACREAGTFIYKKVQVEGYYDDTGAGMTRIVGGPPYRFIETPDGRGKYQRIERATPEEKARAIAWYLEKHYGRKPGQKEWFTHPVSAHVRVTVETDTGYAWRVTLLDRPTARYHYKWPQRGAAVAHKVGKSESVVLDTETGDVIARNTVFGRRPPWFFVWFDTAAFACDGPGRWPYTRSNPLVYREALVPSGKQ